MGTSNNSFCHCGLDPQSLSYKPIAACAAMTGWYFYECPNFWLLFKNIFDKITILFCILSKFYKKRVEALKFSTLFLFSSQINP